MKKMFAITAFGFAAMIANIFFMIMIVIPADEIMKKNEILAMPS